jgi:hypothetical protein
MEIFVDFGLFEILAATGIALVARKIYTRRWPGFAFLIVSVVTPIFLVFFATEGLARWIAVICLATALVNVSLIFMLIRRWDMSILLDKESAHAELPQGAGETRAI